MRYCQGQKHVDPYKSFVINYTHERKKIQIHNRADFSRTCSHGSNKFAYMYDILYTGKRCGAKFNNAAVSVYMRFSDSCRKYIFFYKLKFRFWKNSLSLMSIIDSVRNGKFYSDVLT